MRGSDYLAMAETYQKFQIVEYMIWLAKVFGDVISFGSGQISKVHRFAKIWLNILSTACGKAVN